MPSLPQHNPLNDEHLERINQGLSHIGIAREHIRLAKLAGIDVSALEKDVDASDATLRRIKSVYFPGRT